jgi:hexosaminidase
MLHRMAGAADTTNLQVLADVVEPVKDYNRWSEEKGPIDFNAPLTHLIDAAYPESQTARKFGNLVQQYIQSGYKDQAAEEQIRIQLMLWRNNDLKLRPLLQQSSLLHEAIPVSQNLAMLGAAGLQALDYLDRGQPEPDLWKTQQMAVIEQAKKPVAGLLLMVTAPIQQLVEASSGQSMH